MNAETMHKSSSYPDVLKGFRQRSDHVKTFGETRDQLLNELESLRFVRTCMSLGTGYGEIEIEFIKCCLPNLSKLIVVEKDPNCLRELKVNMENAFGDKIEIKYHEAKIEDFMKENRNLSSKIDLVLAFYVLYFLNSESRKNLFKMCFDQWLEPDKGMFILCNPSKNHVLASLYNKAMAETTTFQHVEKIKNEIKELGLNIVIEKTYNSMFDFRKFGTGLCGMLRAINNGVTEEMANVALEEVCPDGRGLGVCRLFVVQKKN